MAGTPVGRTDWTPIALAELAFLMLSVLRLNFRSDASLFFRPTPYGFRQVVQHVTKHVAFGIN